MGGDLKKMTIWKLGCTLQRWLVLLEARHITDTDMNNDTHEL